MAIDCKKIKQKYEDLLQTKENLESSSNIEKSKKLKAQLEFLAKEIRHALCFVYDELSRFNKEQFGKIHFLREIKIADDGSIYGIADFAGKIYPFANGNITTSLFSISLDDLHTVKNIFLLSNGTFVGTFKQVHSDKYFYGNKIVEQIGGKNIKYINSFDVDKNGNVFGTFTDSEDKNQIFYNNEIVDIFSGLNIDDGFSIFDVKIGKDGEPTGCIRINKKSFFFVGKKIFRDIGDESYDEIVEFHTNKNGIVAGVAKFPDGKSYPFCGNTIYKNVDGMEVEIAEKVTVLENGQLVGKIFSNGCWYPFQGDKVIRSIEGLAFGEKIRLASNSKVFVTGEGKIAGKLEMRLPSDESILLPFVGDNIFREVNGRKIEKVGSVKVLPDGSVYIVVADFQDENTRYFDTFIYDGFDFWSLLDI